MLLASFALSTLLFANPCPVTTAPAPVFVPPAAFAPDLEPNAFWFGTPEFWTELPAAAQIERRDKLFWWFPGFDGSVEPFPSLSVSIRPVGSGVASFLDDHATNAFFGGRWSMLTRVAFPSAGCWEVTGSYRGRSLKFVTAVP